MKSDTINDWKPETRSLINSLIDNGFTIVGGDNGEEHFKRADFATEAAFLEELLACDEGHLYIKRKATKESSKTPGKIVPCVYSIFIVMGNSPGELASDWSVPFDSEDRAALDKATKEHADKWEGRKQPTEIQA